MKENRNESNLDKSKKVNRAKKDNYKSEKKKGNRKIRRANKGCRCMN